MEESKKKVKEIEEWINAYGHPVERLCVADIFYDLKDELEYWWAMYDVCLKECEDIVNIKNKEIQHLHNQIMELKGEATVLNCIKREGN